MQRPCGPRSTQNQHNLPAAGRRNLPAFGEGGPPGEDPARVSGDTRQSVRGSDRPVIELGCGVVVYPARWAGGVWRAVWTEGGRRRCREAATEQGLAVKLEKVLERLSAGAANTQRPGADLIGYYLSPDRLPAGRQWSRKHAHTQARLCERFAAPVIAGLACEDITAGHMQQIVNAAPTPGEGDRVQGMISALVSAGIDGGYLTNPRLKQVHWQAGDRPLPPPRAAPGVVGRRRASLLTSPPGRSQVRRRAALPTPTCGGSRTGWSAGCYTGCSA